MGIVEDIGKNITNLKVGDKVVVPFPIVCGRCYFCKHNLPVACKNSNPNHYNLESGVLTEKGGALFGYTNLYGGHSGGKTQYVFNFGPIKGTEDFIDRQVLFLTDIFPTGYTICLG